MTFTQQLTRLYLEFKDEYIGEHTFDNFMMWLKDETIDNNPYRYQNSCADPNTPTRPVDDRKCFKCLKGEGHNNPILEKKSS